MTATEDPRIRPTGAAGGAEIEGAMRAVPLAVAALRHESISFAAQLGAGEELQQAVALAVSEAVANVVRHAYDGQEPGTVRFHAAVVDGGFEIAIGDRGAGFRPGSDPGLGLGLYLIAEATRDFRIEAADPGTTVTMRFLLDEGI